MKCFVFDLIKTLNSSEKAYIKKHIGFSGKHPLPLLIDLDKFKVYEKDAFIKKNKNKPYIKNLSQNQKYLGEKILEFLTNYRSGKVYEIEIHNKINKIIILIERKFYKKAKERIDKCLEISLEREDYLTCYRLVCILITEVNNKVYFDLSKKDIKSYKTSRDFYLLQLNRIETFSKIGDIWNNIDNPEEKIVHYKNQFEKLGLSNKDDVPGEYPFKCKRIFYFNRAEFERLRDKTDDFILFNKKIINLYELYKTALKFNFSSFLLDSINFLNNLLEVLDFDTFFTEHQKISELINSSERELYGKDSSLIHVIEYLFPLAANNYGRYFEKSIEFSKVYLSFLEEKKSKLAAQFVSRSLIEISCSHLYIRDSDQTLTFLEKALTHQDYHTQYLGRILSILSHYSLKNEFLLDSLFQSFIYYLNKVKRKDQIKNIRKLKKHVTYKTVHQLKNEDFESFVDIHWDLFENV